MTGTKGGPIKYLRDLWREHTPPAGSDELGLLRYRSNLLGSDQRIANCGGGNSRFAVLDFARMLRLRDPCKGDAHEDEMVAHDRPHDSSGQRAAGGVSAVGANGSGLSRTLSPAPRLARTGRR